MASLDYWIEIFQRVYNWMQLIYGTWIKYFEYLISIFICKYKYHMKNVFVLVFQYLFDEKIGICILIPNI